MNTVLFDMDGTLLNTLDDLRASINYALSQSGLEEVSREEARLAAGYGSIVLIEMVGKGKLQKGTPEFQRVFDDFSNHYRQHCNDATKPYPGILELLAALKERGIRMAVVSNKVQPETERLRKLWFGEFIELAIGRREGVAPKPDPAMAQAALSELCAAPTDAIFIGDSQPDVQTGKNAGCVSVGCTWGFRSREVLEQEHADYIIDKPEQLLGIIDMIR